MKTVKTPTDRHTATYTVLTSPAAAKGYEDTWRNWLQYDELPYNEVDDSGKEIPEPEFIKL